MHILYKTPAIVLNCRNIGEADRIFYAFTEEFGLLEIMGKSIRNHSSKLMPNTGLFSLVDMGFISKKNFWLLTQAQELNSFPNIKKNSEKVVLAASLSAFLLRFLHGSEKDIGLWKIILSSFEFLDKNYLDFKEMNNFDFFFKLKALEKLGYVDKSEIKNIIYLPFDKSALKNSDMNIAEMSRILNKAVKESHL